MKNRYLLIDDNGVEVGDANDAWFAGVCARNYTKNVEGDIRVIDSVDNYRTIGMYRAGEKLEKL